MLVELFVCFRKPHKTHKIVSDVSSISHQAAFAEADFDSASNITESQLTDVTPPPRLDSTPTKSCSEHFGLPEGVNVCVCMSLFYRKHKYHFLSVL